MKIISFLFSLLLFLWYLFNHRRREEGTKETKEAEQQQKAFKGIEGDPTQDFYTERINTLNKMLSAASEEEQKTQAKLNHMEELNHYGIIANEKNISRAKADLYKAQRKRLSIQHQIYITEKRREKENEH